MGAGIGALGGGLIGGTVSELNGGNFWDGFSDGIMWGAIGGAVSGAVGGTKIGLLGAAIDGATDSTIYTLQTLQNDGKVTAVGLATSFALGIGVSFASGKLAGLVGSKRTGNPSTKISSEMEKKILEGQRKSPSKNEVIGGHSSSINNNSNFAVEELSINPDGTKNIKFIKDLQDGNISKIKKSTVFPDSWNDSKIIDSIKSVGDSPAVSVRQRDGATWHRQIIDGVEIDVIKLGDDVISGYPTGKINAPKPSGF